MTFQCLLKCSCASIPYSNFLIGTGDNALSIDAEEMMNWFRNILQCCLGFPFCATKRASLKTIGSLIMVRLVIIGIFITISITSVGCAPQRCWLEAINVTYTYSTSCSDVGKERRGTLTFRTPLEQTSIQARQMALTTQAQIAGLEVEEVLLVWSQPKCPSPTNSKATPLTIQNYQRITLAPNSGTKTVQRLLVCEPIGSKSPGTIKKNFLFACRTGQSSQAVCTFELEKKE